jgi:addiction module HigA family antidote
MAEKLKPVTPGEILLEEFLKPFGISQNQIARDIKVPVGRISDIIHGHRGISTDTALRLSVYFKTTPEFWMNLQMRYDLKIAKDDKKNRIVNIVRPLLRNRRSSGKKSKDLQPA